MEENIHSQQINALKIAKKYIHYCKAKTVDIGLTPFCDFVIWAESLGSEKLNLLRKNIFVTKSFIKIFFKEVLSILKNSNFKIVGPELDKKKKVNIIYSYCTKDNFDKNGQYKDFYFNLNSFDVKNTYWLLISLDNFKPKYNKNIFIIYKKKNYDLFYFFKYFFKLVFQKNFLFYFNNTTSYSNLLGDLFFKTFKQLNFNLYMPFENRPHQNLIINISKKISSKNQAYGFYHRLPEPLQLEMFYKNSKIDKLYVGSLIQKKMFVKYYDWPLKKIEVVNSFRYSKFKLRKNYIFFPYKIKDLDFFLTKIEELLEIKKANINNYKFSIHYLNKKSKSHNILKKKIKCLKLKKNTKGLFVPIILGETGSVAAEMLETIGKVYHICNNDLNIFSEKIWTSIEVKKIANGIFLYKKKNNEKLIQLRKRNEFKKILYKNYV